MSSKPSAPAPTLERLATYLQLLSELQAQGVETVSSADIEQTAGIGAAQFRKDVSFFGGFGKPGVGYDVSELLSQIASILRIDHEQTCLLIGAGNLGAALAAYPGFSAYNFHIAAVFDNDPKKIGTSFNGLIVRDISELCKVNDAIDAKIALLAVPAQNAQDVADLLVAAGIKAIMNFAPVYLKTSPKVYVRNAYFLQELAVLSFRLHQAEEERFSH
ncbi:MAG: redox-sensing transcriptional repressor Rex [Armatimonadetes bacterium]|nr:redox-sensing transcriptional repressor Rex [Armatimonadota bacterium]